MATSLVHPGVPRTHQPNSSLRTLSSEDAGLVTSEPLAYTVPGIRRKVEVKVASTATEWEGAFRLVRKNYQESGYEPPSTKLLRFTPFHALPDTTVFVAKAEDQIVATLTLVPDSRPLGLPLEGLYEDEVNVLRSQGRHIAEVTSLAADNLTQREFIYVFSALSRLMAQYHLYHGGDTWVITVNPRHRVYYCKTYGYMPLGPRRSYHAVRGHPAEAFWVDEHLMKAAAPKMHEAIYERPLPREFLQPVRMPVELIRAMAAESSQFDPLAVEALDVNQILGYMETHGHLRLW